MKKVQSLIQPSTKGELMPKVLPIAQLGESILRERASEVRFVDQSIVHDTKIQELIDDMIFTCNKVDGVGISAPQVFQPLRIFVMASRPSARYPYAPVMEPTAMINPLLITWSDVTPKGWEGCLSIPGIRGQVPRSKEIVAGYLDRHGQWHQKEFDGFLAKIFLHELDHLDGIVFLDRTDSRDLVVESEFQKLVAAGKT
ncbi:MAG TPA: peptide deformylase [Candidatus Paceibacterota bacterium]